MSTWLWPGMQIFAEPLPLAALHEPDGALDKLYQRIKNVATGCWMVPGGAHCGGRRAVGRFQVGRTVEGDVHAVG
jgi:hypothetical protein